MKKSNIQLYAISSMFNHHIYSIHCFAFNISKSVVHNLVFSIGTRLPCSQSLEKWCKIKLDVGKYYGCYNDVIKLMHMLIGVKPQSHQKHGPVPQPLEESLVFATSHIRVSDLKRRRDDTPFTSKLVLKLQNFKFLCLSMVLFREYTSGGRAKRVWISGKSNQMYVIISR